jgi:hypothetical protein
MCAESSVNIRDVLGNARFSAVQTPHINLTTTILLLLLLLLLLLGHALTQLFEALPYKSRVRFSMVSLEFFIDVILPAALWPWG